MNTPLDLHIKIFNIVIHTRYVIISPKRGWRNKINKFICSCFDHEWDYYWGANCNTDWCVRCNEEIPQKDGLSIYEKARSGD